MKGYINVSAGSMVSILRIRISTSFGSAGTLPHSRLCIVFLITPMSAMVITSLRCSVGGYYIQEVQVNGLEKIVINQCRRPYVDNIITGSRVISQHTSHPLPPLSEENSYPEERHIYPACEDGVTLAQSNYTQLKKSDVPYLPIRFTSDSSEQIT